MKRLIPIALTIAMLASTSAFAAEVNNDAGTDTAVVKATLVEGRDASPIVYSVEIEWETMEFTYYEESAATWNPSTLKYDTGYQAEGWDPSDKASVTISNSSNTDILATFTYEANAGYESAKMNFTANELYVASADDGNGTGSVKTGTSTVTPGGKLESAADNAEIGNITITIKKCEDIAKAQAEGFLSEVRTYVTGMNMSKDYMGYTVVDSADDAESGGKYILKSDVDTLNTTVSTFESDVNSVSDETLNAAEQAALNQLYYAFKAHWEDFNATKLQIKK